MAVLLLSGWMSTERTGWFPWLTRNLTERGVDYRFCRMTNFLLPFTDSTARRAAQHADTLGGEPVVICHSFGGKVALKALSDGKMRARALVMVAPLYRWPLGTWFRFWKEYIEFDSLRGNCGKIVVIHSRDDRLVPFRNGSELVSRLQEHGIDAELIAMDGRGHFDPAARCFELPELLEIYDRLAITEKGTESASPIASLGSETAFRSTGR